MQRVLRFVGRFWQPLAGLLVGVLLTVTVVLLLNRDGTDPTLSNGTPAGAFRPTAVSQFHTPTPIAMVNIVIAVQELPRGFRIPPNAVAVRPWPADSAPFNGITNVEDVVGRITRTDIFREQPILTNMLVDDYQNLANELGRVGSDMGAVLPSNLVAITVFVPATELPQGVRGGDRVDLLHSIPLPESQTQGGPEQDFGYLTQVTVRDALVMYVGAVPADGRFIGAPPTPTPIPDDVDEASSGVFDFEGTTGPGLGGGFTLGTANRVPVTLGVTPQDASYIVWARNADLPLTLVIRAPTDTSQLPNRAVDLDGFAQEFGYLLPWQTPNATATAQFHTRNTVTADALKVIQTQTAVSQQVATEVFATQTAQVTPTATFTRLPTLTPTPTPELDETDIAETEQALSNLSPFQLTATDITRQNATTIAGATQTQIARNLEMMQTADAFTETPNPFPIIAETAAARLSATPTPSTHQLTATAILDNATATAAATPTPEG